MSGCLGGAARCPRTQVATLRHWIEEGAEYQTHWAFISPERSALPSVADTAWPRNAVDSFVLARLEQDGLTPSEEADRATLLRRATLDLTGVPPTPTELGDFLNDDSPDAYEEAVDRLLASPRYGERMAAEWLDAARYADTNGYQTDGERQMWRWRDWVIDAYNENMPFDQFTVEQLAGDMLPNATLDQRIATAFNRNHSLNSEGGIVPEEFLTEYAVDRVSTTGTGLDGADAGLRALSRSQIRPDQPERVLRSPGELQQHPRARQGVQVCQFAAAGHRADHRAAGRD